MIQRSRKADADSTREYVFAPSAKVPANQIGRMGDAAQAYTQSSACRPRIRRYQRNVAVKRTWRERIRAALQNGIEQRTLVLITLSFFAILLIYLLGYRLSSAMIAKGRVDGMRRDNEAIVQDIGQLTQVLESKTRDVDIMYKASHGLNLNAGNSTDAQRIDFPAQPVVSAAETTTQVGAYAAIPGYTE